MISPNFIIRGLTEHQVTQLIQSVASDITLRRPQRTTLFQLRSGHCRLLNSYQNRLKPTVDPRCPDCGVNPHDVPHLFNCTAHPNDLSTVNLWDKPVESIRELGFLDPRNLD